MNALKLGFAGLMLAATVARADEAACKGLTFEDGRITTGRPIPLAAKDDDACLGAIAEAVRARPAIRSLTVNARVPDAQRLDGQALAAAKHGAEVLVKAGLPATFVSALAGPPDANAAGALVVQYEELKETRPIARVLRLEGTAKTGFTESAQRPVKSGNALFAGAWLVTGAEGALELRLADGSRLTLGPATALRLQTVGLDAARHRSVALVVKHGDAVLEIAADEALSQVTVETPQATLATAGGVVEVHVDAKQGTRVEVARGEVVVSHGDVSRPLAAHHGVIVAVDGAVGTDLALLAPPVPSAPLFGLHPAGVPLTWQPVAAAVSYRVEVARDASFLSPLPGLVAVGTSAALPANLETAKWFWRVAAVDAQGLASAPSKVYSFEPAPAKAPAVDELEIAAPAKTPVPVPVPVPVPATPAPLPDGFDLPLPELE